MEVIIIWLAFAIITAFAASARGRSAVGWFFLGLLFSALALILVLVMPNLSEQDAPAAPDSLKDKHARRQVISRHMGRAIMLGDGAYWVGNQRFLSEDDAKRHIEAEQSPTQVASPTGNPRALGDGMFDQIVAGTKSCQPAIRALPKQRGKFLVTLRCQPDNPYDDNAVAVEHQGTLLGFLPREDAEDWRDELDETRLGTASVDAYAKLVRSEEHETVGMRLDILWPLQIVGR